MIASDSALALVLGAVATAAAASEFYFWESPWGACYCIPHIISLAHHLFITMIFMLQGKPRQIVDANPCHEMTIQR